MSRRLLPLLALGAPFWAQASTMPAFCVKAAGTVEQAICADPKLVAIDRQLDQVYTEALAKADAAQRKALLMQQKGWWRGVRDCWKAQDMHACIAEAYVLRRVELQATYHLVRLRGTFSFTCDDGSTVKVTHFKTDPPSLIAARGGEQSLMLSQPSGSGARYAGRNEQFWEHQGSATVVWGHGTPELHCKRT
ncbi:MliC family protein [Massilia niastensis]|uniref:MliC family protein n=1 Tax=Massilia niastensis TaxID=544911 RepID=UPI00037CCFE1|nr:MliC family protein [Massilia niastensis]